MSPVDLQLHAWRKATYRAPHHAGRTVLKLDDGKRWPSQLPPNWSTLGRALGDAAMIRLGDDFATGDPAAAEAAMRRLSRGWCPHPPEYIMRGRQTTESALCWMLGGSQERLARWDECALCGWRMNARISHVPLHPAGAPALPTPAAGIASE